MWLSAEDAARRQRCSTNEADQQKFRDLFLFFCSFRCQAGHFEYNGGQALMSPFGIEVLFQAPGGSISRCGTWIVLRRSLEFPDPEGAFATSGPRRECNQSAECKHLKVQLETKPTPKSHPRITPQSKPPTRAANSQNAASTQPNTKASSNAIEHAHHKVTRHQHIFLCQS